MGKDLIASRLGGGANKEISLKKKKEKKFLGGGGSLRARGQRAVEATTTAQKGNHR